MKKCLVAVMVIFSVISCNSKKEDDSTQTTEDAYDAVACIDLKDYYKQTTLSDKVKWLHDHGNDVCDSIMEPAVLKDHVVKLGDVSGQGEKFTIEWDSLKNIIKAYGYEKYVSVEHTGKKITSLKLVDAYANGTDFYCYSTKLINTLAKTYITSGTTKFEFSFATINKEDAVVIQIGKNSFYDYSTDPKFIPVPYIPL